MDRRLGEPLPHQLSNPTRAHPCAINLWHQKHASPMHYAVLAVVSNCCPPHKGRLLTRYSPVRHWSYPKVITVRLECVMHAASVHPEPGSNSQTIVCLPLSRSDPVWAIYSSFLYFFRVVFSLVLTDFVFALANFALYFFLLLFNCQASIAHLLCVSLSIISHLFSLVNTFFKSFLKIFSTRLLRCFMVAFLRQLGYYSTKHNVCQ